MSERGDENSSEADPAEEINVDDSDSRSCDPDSPPPPPSLPSSQGQKDDRLRSEPAPRNHPFSISRLLGDQQHNRRQSNRDTNTTDDEDQHNQHHQQQQQRIATSGGIWPMGCWSDGGPETERCSDRDDDDTGSTPDTTSQQQQHRRSSPHQLQPSDLLAPFRLFPGASGLLYSNGVIRVPAHRPQGGGGNGTSGQQNLLPPWATGALGPLGGGGNGPVQQQAAAAAAAATAGLHTARFLANLAAHPLQAHPHLKDRLAGK